MSEKYSLEQAQKESSDIREGALELKKERNEMGEPSRMDYASAEQALQEAKAQQANVDNEKLEKLRASLVGEKETGEGEKNYQENIQRHKIAVAEYIEKNILNSVPESYRDEYGRVLQEQMAVLAQNPIEPNCKMSLVLPAYREEKVILATLESLEKQTGINPDELEIIVVVNYPMGKKPSLNDYDEEGIRIGEHLDRTKELVEEFSKQAKIKILTIEQDFPEYYIDKKGQQEKLAGVGMASKLGMDLALMRQKNNPQVIGYYGADTLFDPNWTKECLHGFALEGVDAVRGMQRGIKVDNRVEDENGLHILSEKESSKIQEFEGRRYKYYHRLGIAINKEALAKGSDTKKEAHGVATQTAGMYAHIGGMNIFPGGEDIANAQTVSESGKIFENEKMVALAIGRFEEPRTKGGSYTRGLWNMYRAFQYGEENDNSFSLDSNGNLLVDDPENFHKKKLAMNEVLKSLKNFHSNGAVGLIMEKLFSADDFLVMQAAKEKHVDSYAEFEKEITQSLAASFKKKFNESYPLRRIRIEEAEKKMLVSF